jgi:hypothetical protein
MDTRINVQPLPHRKRQHAFLFLIGVFLISLPFLYMYATGYRFDIEKPTTLVSTGGLYIAVESGDAQIYIDDELMRETRAFRKAFYAQGLDAGTHRVYVQKDGYHTWVKELPVTKHRVTEAEAFNFPLVPQVRVLSPWQTATGTTVVAIPLQSASSTNELIATTTKKTSTFVRNEEYYVRLQSFSTTSTSTSVSGSVTHQIKDIIARSATTTEDIATSTVISSGVALHRSGDEVYATWVGSFEQMPYYYCAEEFPRYDGSTTTEIDASIPFFTEEEPTLETESVMHPVQTIPADGACDPTIRIDRKNQNVHGFDFYPGNTDLAVVILDDGLYAIEIDDRAWQNAQLLFKGSNLRMHIENGSIYLYDGVLIYQVVVDQS